ncbi:MAG: biliverdin-producing heme oxygenase [Gammaproteobacteria bacterium]
MSATASHYSSPLLLALREGTHTCHKRLEARLPFFSADFDRAAYRRLMQAYFGFHAPLESLLGAYQECERVKTPTLVTDLLALAMTRAQIDTLPLCRALPQISDQASALGVMYVVEGSTLGGQVLKRAMTERLALGADSGAGFLDVYGPLTGARWRSFLERLEQAPSAAKDQTRTVQAAIATFECFEQWLAQQGVLR